jgi:hypothetical protein
VFDGRTGTKSSGVSDSYSDGAVAPRPATTATGFELNSPTIKSDTMYEKMAQTIQNIQKGKMVCSVDNNPNSLHSPF